MRITGHLNFLYSNRTKAVWYALVLSWAVIRTLIVKGVFEDNGVNPGIYLAIDLAASVPYARYTHIFVISYLEKDWKKLKAAGVISVLTFYAPDLYILLSAREVPRNIYIGFFIILSVFSAAAINGVLRKIKPRSPR